MCYVILVFAVIKRILTDLAIVDTLRREHVVASVWKCKYEFHEKMAPTSIMYG